MPHRRFTESESADLLGRAARLQAADQQRGPDETLSLAELKQAAQAAGIDPLYVEQAVHAPPADAPAFPRKFGMSTGIRRTRLVPGPISEEAWGEMVAEMRRTLDGRGDTETVGAMRDWTHEGHHLSAEPEGDQVRLTATKAWRGEPTALLFALAALLILSALFLATGLREGETAMIGMGIAYGVFAGLTGLAWPNKRRTKAKLRDTYEGLLDRLEQIARRHASPEATAHPALEPFDELSAPSEPAPRTTTRTHS
ncbi:MAG: hypothetical protein AAF970_07490 [Bacteroidota bacterium]